MGIMDAALHLAGMQPLKTGRIESEDIFALRSVANNAFLLPLKAGFLAIDAGNSSRDLQEGCAALKISPNKVTDLLLTHGDLDHTGGLDVFPQAQLYIGVRELGEPDATGRLITTKGRRLPEGLSRDSFVLLEDGQRLQIGGREIECIATPGHSPGQMAYLIDGKYLFAGDAFKLKNGTPEPHPFSVDAQQSKATIEALFKRIPEGCLVLTAHFGMLRT
ncbi:MAG: MBL fold metallo-hydrolase [Coriobacteriia bacterium]|nr:MBL fold metallo-hydrolase [Coriobacteriia bacterium]